MLSIRAKSPWILRYCVIISPRFGRRYISSSFGSPPLELAGNMKNGDKLHGYTVNSVTDVPELDLVAVQLTHDKTNAKHLHLARDDTNNAFGVGFLTTPMDNTGVAHILEHTVLCGSQKYPVRDPFFKMMNRSLATFMNAFTASDWTFYPFSTQNQKDYYNLMSVYTDSVFHPLLREMDFRQEGWRLEHEDPKDKESPVIFKGVVFNEMKGFFASPENVYSQKAQNLLYRSHTYSNVSGGDPLSILDLTWEQLKEFHSMHYHPSNSRFFTYGNFPLDGHLDYLNAEVLQNFEHAVLCMEVPLESRWTEPKEHRTCGPVGTMSQNTGNSFVGTSFLLSPITDSYSSLVLSIMSQLLVEGPTSPFYQSLIDSNIGSEYTPNTGYDSSTKEGFFSIGLQGVKADDVGAVKGLIWDTLDRVSREGFKETRVSSILHQIDLGMKHQTSNFGLSLMMTLLSPWMHGANPTDFLLMNRNIERVKKGTQDSAFWAKCIDRYLLSNNHSLTLIMSMNEQYALCAMERENMKKNDMLSSLSDCQKEELYKEGLELIEDQDCQLGAIDSMPTLNISDVSKYTSPICLEHKYSGGVPVQYSEQPTNNIIYLKIKSGISLLPDDLKKYIPLFCTALTQFGTERIDYRNFSQLCDLYTGGLTVNYHVCSHYNSLMTLDQSILFSSYCLDYNLPSMLNLWDDLFCRPPHFEEQRLRTIINIAANNAAMSVPSSGHLLAIRSASSGLTPSSTVSENFSGLTQVSFLKSLVEHQDLSDVSNKLQCIASEILHCGSLRCAINSGMETSSALVNTMDRFFQTLPGEYAEMSSLSKVIDFSTMKKEMRHDLNLPVNYVGYAIKTVPYNHKDSPSLDVLAKLMTSRYLHKEIREKGGAYGAGAIFSDGIFSFYSYRDPNTQATLDSFYRCIHWCVNGEFSEDDVNQAKLLVFAQLDYPVSAGSRGSLMFLHHITFEMQQAYREQIFATSKTTMMEVAARYMLNDVTSGTAVIT